MHCALPISPKILPRLKAASSWKDPATGEPTGWLGDTSLQQVGKLIPALSHEERVAALRAAMQELNALGITGIIEASSDRDDPGLRAYKELWTKGELTIRSRVVVGAPSARHPWPTSNMPR